MPDDAVLMLTEGLAHMVRADPACDFAIVGPWLAQAAGSDWLADGGGRAVRVALSSGMDRFDRTVFAQLPALKEIVVFGAGQDGIDLAEATRRGIRINAAGATHAGDVAEHGVAMILAQRRAILAGDGWVRSGRWQREGRQPSTRRLSGARVGIVGLGHIGRACADRLAAFGCEIGWWGPHPKPDAPWPRAKTLIDLAAASDILVVAVFAHDSTRGLISAAVIDALGAEGLLVNLSRGFVVDEAALIAALSARRLGSAALDVFAEEPTPPEQWADVPNVLLTPHSAGDTRESLAELRVRAIGAVRAALGQTG